MVVCLINFKIHETKTDVTPNMVRDFNISLSVVDGIFGRKLVGTEDKQKQQNYSWTSPE